MYPTYIYRLTHHFQKVAGTGPSEEEDERKKERKKKPREQ
jgi:hypothetical protein